MEQNERQQRTAAPESSEGASVEGLSMRPPAFQLMASPLAPPAQMKAGSVKDFDKKQAETSESQVEGTAEFQQFMAEGSIYQSKLKLTRDEARLACLLMVEAHHKGENVDMKATGEVFAQQARARLNPQAGHGVIPRLGTEISEVSETRAQELFNMLATLSFWNDKGEKTPIPFHYPVDGCYARAHLMSEKLTAMGYGNRKQFAVSQDQYGDGNLTAQTDYAGDTGIGKKPQVVWWYHVAPIITVTQKDNSKQEMVIDPSMASMPISVSDWISKMGVKNYKEMTLGEIQKEVGSKGWDFSNDNPVAYSTDRAHFMPTTTMRETPDDTSSHVSMNNYRPKLREYVTRKEAHELAALIRKQLESGSIATETFTEVIEEMSQEAKAYFMNKFKWIFLQIRLSKFSDLEPVILSGLK